MKKVFLLILLSIYSNVYASECPFETKGAQLMLNIENKIQLKVSSSLICNQKLLLPDQLFDSEIEVWKGDILIAQFYSRKSTYSSVDGKLFLEDATLIKGDSLNSSKLKKLSRIYMNLKKQKIYTNVGEIAI